MVSAVATALDAGYPVLGGAVDPVSTVALDQLPADVSDAPLAAPFNPNLHALLASDLTINGALLLNHHSLSGDLANYTPEELNAACRFTRLPHVLPNGDWTILELPKFSAMSRASLHLLRDDAGAPVTITVDSDQDGEDEMYRIVVGSMLGCANMGFRTLFLSPIESPQNTVRSYENDLRWACFRMRDPAPEGGGQPIWMCGQGKLGDGVVGYAYRDLRSGPRTFFARSITWGMTTWDAHYEFVWAGLGAISERIADDEITGFARTVAWGLNPNDSHADGRSKARDYLAAVALKSTTYGSGIAISPYNVATGSFDPEKLNSGEVVEPDGMSFYQIPDLASTGRIVDGVLIDVHRGPSAGAPGINGCPWDRGWNIPIADTTTIPMPDLPSGDEERYVDLTSPVGYVLAANIADSSRFGSRCPSHRLTCNPDKNVSLTVTLRDNQDNSGTRMDDEEYRDGDEWLSIAFPDQPARPTEVCRRGSCTVSLPCGHRAAIVAHRQDNAQSLDIPVQWDICRGDLSAACTVYASRNSSAEAHFQSLYGNGTCDAGENYAYPADCQAERAQCGNGLCQPDMYEDANTCPGDCAAVANP
ncbi:MAG: hypothetical protein AAGC55_10505 [Myxococcota bacterium]